MCCCTTNSTSASWWLPMRVTSTATVHIRAWANGRRTTTRTSSWRSTGPYGDGASSVASSTNTTGRRPDQRGRLHEGRSRPRISFWHGTGRLHRAPSGSHRHDHRPAHDAAPRRSRQVWVRKASGSEPLMTCRNGLQWRRNRGETWVPGQVWGEPADCPDGVRHVGGASLIRALARNVRTCRPDTVPGVCWGREGVSQAAHTVRGRVPSRGTGADRLVVVMKPGNAGGAKGTGHPGLLGGQPAGPGGAR